MYKLRFFKNNLKIHKTILQIFSGCVCVFHNNRFIRQTQAEFSADGGEEAGKLEKRGSEERSRPISSNENPVCGPA